LLLRELMRRRVVVDGGVAMDNVDDGFSRPAADRWTTSARCPSSSSTIALSVVEDGEVGAFVTSCGIVLGAGHESFVLCRPECELCQSTRSCLDRSVRASTACMHTFGSTCSWSLAHKGPLAQYPRYQWLVFCALLVCGWHMRGTTTGTQPLLVHRNSAAEHAASTNEQRKKTDPRRPAPRPDRPARAPRRSYTPWNAPRPRSRSHAPRIPGSTALISPAPDTTPRPRAPPDAQREPRSRAMSLVPR